ncbi:T9SS type A sorting domain-containing protein [Bacteroidales bacterium OttesenSCG-928-L03]|nr:T9SS type A sorting domain-containing protein [Bacteroidales bacterium OttesenSCG-928-L03]
MKMNHYSLSKVLNQYSLFIVVLLLLGNSSSSQAQINNTSTGTSYKVSNENETTYPVDMTGYISNPSFNNNASTGWVGVGTVDYNEVEFYQSTFNMYQQISGLPAGTYTLKVQSFERPTGNDSGAAYKAGTEVISARVYAKPGKSAEVSTPFNSLYQHTFSGTGALNGYANTMASAQTMFATKENYETILSNIIVGEGDVLIIGAKSTTSRSGYWVLFDNFRLEYNDVVALIRVRLTMAQELVEGKMNNSIRESLNSAITQAEAALATDPIVAEEMYRINTLLQNGIEQASASIAAYIDLQAALDKAKGVYDENKANDIAIFKAVLDKAQALIDSSDSETDELISTVTELEKASLAYLLANPTTALVPNVTTNPNFARGSTAFLGRCTVSTTSANRLETGFCWATHPEPTVLDNRTTKSFTNNGTIYHIEGLQPATVYYMRAYCIHKKYTVGYGETLKVITLPKGTMTYTLNSSVTGSGEHYPRIAEAVRSAVEYFNNYTSIQGHHLSVNYNAGTPTAEAGYGGYMQFGANPSYQRTGTAMHEGGHTIGVGQHTYWTNTSGSPLRLGTGTWLGDRASKMVQFFDNNTTGVLKGDGTHMWPYGVNGASEDNGSEILYIANAVIHQALGEDGLPPTGGFTTPAYTFECDTIKYYIKNEAESRGRDTSFLVENASGNLVYETMTASAVLENNKAAWYFDFVPATGYYRIRNAASGKYFTYKSSGTNGIGLTTKTTPTDTENFQMMKARIDTKIGTGTTAFTSRGYWIVRPEAKLNPLCFGANSGGTTTATTFNIANSATTQRWFVWSEEEVELFSKALPPTSLQEAESSGAYIHTVNNEMLISNIPVASDITIYNTAGQLQASANSVSDSYSQALSKGVYIVSIQSPQYQDVKKIIVW